MKEARFEILNNVMEPLLVIDVNTAEIIFKNRASMEFFELSYYSSEQSLHNICVYESQFNDVMKLAKECMLSNTRLESNVISVYLENETSEVKLYMDSIEKEKEMVMVTVRIAESQLRKITEENELFRSTLSFTNDALFSIDINKNTLKLVGNAPKSFGMPSEVVDFIDIIEGFGIVFQDDMDTFRQLISNMKQGIEKSMELRLNSLDGRNDWYIIEYTLRKNENEVVYEVVGKIHNIQEGMELQNKANTDLLTGCLNKITFESYVCSYFEEKNQTFSHAFMIIDIDDFKAVNDNLGHYFGDIVLKEIAGKLKRIFRETDYISRIGGDEFAVLMKNINDVNKITEKAKEILAVLNNTYQGDNGSYTITGSVGICLYPLDGINYVDIYKNADVALYHSKSRGKNTYTFYNTDLDKGTMINTTPFDVANRALSYYFDQEVAMDVFNLLFEMEDYKKSVDIVLGHIGEHFGVDRCYIFEKSNKNIADEGAELLYDNTFEWCRAGVEPQMDYLQDITLELFTELFEGANEEGVYYCNNLQDIVTDETREVLASQDILSFLHTYVKRQGAVDYVLGFDDCSSQRMWRPTEISTLMYACRIIAQFLDYRRTIDLVYTESEEKMEVFDSLNFYAYIIDMNTHKITYFNKKTKAIIQSLELGAICHKAIRGYEDECPDCPLKLMRKNNATRTKSVIYNEILDLYVVVTASKIVSADGSESVVVSSTDIGNVFEGRKREEIDLEQYTVCE